MVNKWTRDDLPSISDLCQADDERGNGERTVTLAIALDAVVDRLNKDYQWSTWVEGERDMWRNSYGIAAVRLEQARERADAAVRPEVTRNDVHNAPRGGHMTTVYRAYSPSRDEATSAQEDMGYVQGVAATRNQHAAVTPGPADWTVQTGHIQWEQA